MSRTNPSPMDVFRLRHHLKLTQTEFGNITFSSTSAVCRWENGSRKMHPVLWDKYLELKKPEQ